MSTFGPLVSADWLRQHLQDDDLRLIDFRWYSDGRSGYDAYRSGHIPGAVFVDLEGEITGNAPNAGRHPLPEAAAMEWVMREAGVSQNSQVVVYDDKGGFVAGRLWWLLRYFGHQEVAVLDGGLAAWLGQLEEQEVTPPPGNFVASPPQGEMKLDFEQVSKLSDDTILLDARAPERYRGEAESIDPKAGHIPGALNAPWAGNLDQEGKFRSAEELRRRFQEFGVSEGREVVAYCGSGVSACHNLIALEIAGFKGARLYPGSWSDWSSRDAPIATGSE